MKINLNTLHRIRILVSNKANTNRESRGYGTTEPDVETHTKELERLIEVGTMVGLLHEDAFRFTLIELPDDVVAAVEEVIGKKIRKQNDDNNTQQPEPIPAAVQSEMNSAMDEAQELLEKDDTTAE